MPDEDSNKPIYYYFEGNNSGVAAHGIQNGNFIEVNVPLGLAEAAEIFHLTPYFLGDDKSGFAINPDRVTEIGQSIKVPEGLHGGIIKAQNTHLNILKGYGTVPGMALIVFDDRLVLAVPVSPEEIEKMRPQTPNAAEKGETISRWGGTPHKVIDPR